MRIGIIAEGTEDQAVISNILRAYGIDSSDILSIRPNLQQDATDAGDRSATIGTFQGVKNACEGSNGSRPLFEMAFTFSAIDAMVVHIDTAEIEQQNFIFSKPTKVNNPEYCVQLRGQAIDLINSWLDHQYIDQLLYAIAIEEIEAWCLTLLEKVDTSQSANAKKRLNHKKGSKFKFDGNNLARSFDQMTAEFRKFKTLKKYFPYNQSLKDFADSVEQATQAFNS